MTFRRGGCRPKKREILANWLIDGSKASKVLGVDLHQMASGVSLKKLLSSSLTAFHRLHQLIGKNKFDHEALQYKDESDDT